MALNYYDDAIVAKLKNWMPQTTDLRVLGPDETTRLYAAIADDTEDSKITLPLIALSRNKDFSIESTIKQPKSFQGLKIKNDVVNNSTALMNVIPINTTYQLDILAKTRLEVDEYVRQFLFKLINNPLIIIDIPYNGLQVRHTANLRVLDTVSDTSEISVHIFPGQFYKWTIQMELHDGFLFNIPYKRNWQIIVDDTEKIVIDPDSPAEKNQAKTTLELAW